MSDRLQELIAKIMVAGPQIEVLNEYEDLLKGEEDPFVKRSATEALISSLSIHAVELERAERLCRLLLEQEPEPHLVGLLGTILMQQGREADGRALVEKSKEMVKSLLE